MRHTYLLFQETETKAGPQEEGRIEVIVVSGGPVVSP